MKDSYEFQVICKNLVIEYVNSHFDKTDDVKPIGIKDVYVVWLCKTLQNSKALLSTTIPDGKYYEFTYNGDKSEMYMDVYTKLENICIPEIMFDAEVHKEGDK